MKRALCFAGVVLSVAAAAGAGGCGVDDFEPIVARAPGDGGTEGGGIAEPAVACADPEAAVYGDPGALPADKGAVIKCSKGGEITAEEIQARLTGIGPTSAATTSGARVYKVSYRTERGNGTPGYTSAVVYVPTAPRAGTLPLVVAARGTRGQAPACAVSKADIMAAPAENDYARLVLTIVGNGFAVIVPDLPGYANYGAPGNPPPAYAQAEDVGKATLDGSRALKGMFPQLGDQTVLVGHSQGGHSALAALALAETYGAQGPIAGVAVYAPLWLSQRSWGAILEPGVASNFPIAEAGTANAVSVWYHYTQAELLDGPGEGAKLFKADKQAAITQFVDTACVGQYELLADNANHAYELFEDAFVASLGARAAYGGDCGSDTVCAKWIGRYTADRPHLTGPAATTPIYMFYGLKDETIPEERMRCALDRLQADGTNLTVCVEPDATHGTIIDARGQHVAQWIASLTDPNSAGDLPSCPAGAEAIQKPCATPPPND